MSFFRGYIRLKGKKPRDPFKNAPLRSFDQVKDEESYAGVLQNDTVLIDIDDGKQAETLLKIVQDKALNCQVRQTTRGMHFYFTNDGTWEKCATGVTLAIGLTADIKVGVTNCYAVLKKDGVNRETIYDVDGGLFEGGEYQAPPKWLHPVKTNVSVFNMHEGEGRNTKLFSYILSLQRAGFDRSEIRETLRVINDYVFETPLSKSEFDTITRDEAFDTALETSFFTEKGGFLFDQFALHLIGKLNIKRINGQLHFYDNGCYRFADQSKLENAMIGIIPTLSARQRSEVYKYIDVTCCDNVKESDCRLICFQNGIYDIASGELLPFSPEIVITNQIPWSYNPLAYCDTVDKMLNKVSVGDKDVRALLEEMAGYCFFRRNELRKYFILTGDTSNGKSTYINMLSTMLGSENITTIDLREVGEKFTNAELFGKLANLGDDIGEGFIEDSSVFKKFVSGDSVQVQRKQEKPFFFKNYAKFIFSANTIPRVRDKSGAVLNRTIIIPFNATFSKNDPDFDPFISDKLKQRDAIEYLITLAIAGLKRVLARQSFSESTKVAEALKQYNEENNPIVTFLNELEEGELVRESISELYLRYQSFCDAEGVRALGRTAFTRFVLKSHGDLEVFVTRVNGKCTRRFRAK